MRLLTIHHCLPIALLVLMLGGPFNARAQTSAASEPDYSKVDDFLDGQRTLFSINDVMIGGLVLPTDDGTKIPESDVYTLPGFVPVHVNIETAVRMFDSSHDTLIYNNVTVLFAADPDSGKAVKLSIGGPGDELDLSAIATGDFKQNGFKDVVIASKSGVRIVAARDPHDFAKGLYTGPVFKPANYLADYRTSNTNLSLAVGDFLGDGQHEVALFYGNTDKNKALLDILTVDPKTLALTSKSEFLVVLHAPTFSVTGSLAAGRFGSAVHDQLAMGVYAYKSIEPQHRLTIRSFDVDSSFKVIQKDGVATPFESGGDVAVQAARFNPASPYYQLAVKYDLGRGKVRLGIVTFDTALKIRLPNFTVAPVSCSVAGLSVGNFSRIEPVPTNPDKTQQSLLLQLAIETDNCSGRDMGLNIFNVNPPATPGGDFTIDPKQAFTRTTNDPQWLQNLNLPIIAIDTRGRSFILGQPTKVVIEDTDQPSVVAAMPPMHVDFIPPVGSNTPEILNVSAIPDGFRTLYETTSSEEKESSTTNTASWSYGAEQKVSASVEIGSVEDGFGAKVSAATRAAQDFKEVSETEHGSYEAKKFSVHVKTGFSDHVWLTGTRFNIYVYPVLGKTVCPAAEPDCKESEKFPLTIQFSAPDYTSYEHLDGKLVPWYQPPWEPGNLLSYPANFGQLQQSVPAIDKLSADNTWRTDESTLTEQTDWIKEETNGTSTSVDENYSFNHELSVAGACCGRLVTGTVSAELNLSGSTGFTDLNKAIATVGKSTGLGVEKPGTFLTPTNYNYAVTPYIFGQPHPPSMVDKVPLEGDVETSGILRTAFVANPLRTNAGRWWRSAYSSAPDVGLSHPSRWEIESLGLENPIPRNCRQVGSRETTMDCAIFGPSFPNKPWDSLFHIMRGFFISSALNPGKGPQLTTAMAGDKLTLEARVYNFSFAPMPSNSEVHVRFYVQPLDERKNPIGNSQLINEQDVVLSSIPPFSEDVNAPANWVLATSTFDTTPYESQYLTFWVVVWMQTPDGKLVPEIAGHGLKRIPGTLNSIADVKTEAYSNNVGFYNSEFYVFAKNSLAAEPPTNAEPATIAMDPLSISDCQPLRGHVTRIATLLNAEHNSASGVTAIFYDGDPNAGGTAFGFERAPYIAENSLYTIEAPYFASTCGPHDIYVVVHPGAADEVVQKSSLTVECH